MLLVPTGTVTYHRQVLRKPVYLTSEEGVINQDTFKLSSVVVDAVNGLETAPQGALQLDFANKNIGGGALDRVSTAYTQRKSMSVKVYYFRY